VRVRYFQYRDAVDAIKRNQLDNDYYHREINHYRNCEVLLLDDLFKGAENNGTLVAADKRIMFGIINHRYNECKPMLVSSELFPEQIKDLDEGIGSRIIENCRGRMIKFNDPGLNHRLYG
ncbi:MAG: DnaA/Hda family protein, partial [Bacillota bacterium]|nr:DnaA/Hda family protein [Bacillota bacterium]